MVDRRKESYLGKGLENKGAMYRQHSTLFRRLPCIEDAKPLLLRGWKSHQLFGAIYFPPFLFILLTTANKKSHQRWQRGNNHVSMTIPVCTYHVIEPKLICRKSLGDIREYIYIIVVWLIAGSGFGSDCQRLGYFTSSPLALAFRSKKMPKNMAPPWRPPRCYTNNFGHTLNYYKILHTPLLQYMRSAAVVSIFLHSSPPTRVHLQHKGQILASSIKKLPHHNIWNQPPCEQ